MPGSRVTQSRRRSWRSCAAASTRLAGSSSSAVTRPSSPPDDGEASRHDPGLDGARRLDAATGSPGARCRRRPRPWRVPLPTTDTVACCVGGGRAAQQRRAVAGRRPGRAGTPAARPSARPAGPRRHRWQTVRRGHRRLTGRQGDRQRHRQQRARGRRVALRAHVAGAHRAEHRVAGAERGDRGAAGLQVRRPPCTSRGSPSPTGDRSRCRRAGSDDVSGAAELRLPGPAVRQRDDLRPAGQRAASRPGPSTCPTRSPIAATFCAIGGDVGIGVEREHRQQGVDGRLGARVVVHAAVGLRRRRPVDRSPGRTPAGRRRSRRSTRPRRCRPADGCPAEPVTSAVASSDCSRESTP